MDLWIGRLDVCFYLIVSSPALQLCHILLVVYVHEMSLNIDMKIFRPVNSSGRTLIFDIELLDFVAKLQRGESWESIPLEFHWLTVNFVQSSVLW